MTGSAGRARPIPRADAEVENTQGEWAAPVPTTELPSKDRHRPHQLAVERGSAWSRSES